MVWDWHIGDIVQTTSERRCYRFGVVVGLPWDNMINVIHLGDDGNATCVRWKIDDIKKIGEATLTDLWEQMSDVVAYAEPHCIEHIPDKIIRCKDCAKQWRFDCPMSMLERGALIFVEQRDDFFCGAAERKET